MLEQYTSRGPRRGATRIPATAWGSGKRLPFGAFCAVGTYRTVAANRRIALLRGSTLLGGGGFASLWTSAVSEQTSARGVAIRSTTVFVAGTAKSAGPTLLDQVLLANTY